MATDGDLAGDQTIIELDQHIYLADGDLGSSDGSQDGHSEWQ